MPGLPCLISRASGNDLHAGFLRAQGNVDVDVVDTGVREDPHRVARIERVRLHDRVPVPFGTLEKQELVNSHLSCNASEEGERQLDHRMKPDESSNSWIHLFHGNRRMTAAE